jgi:putative peptidoglycan lipid II flippase
MGAATAVSRLIGFGRILVVAAVLGTTDLGDVFLASNSVSNVLFDLLAAGALSAVLVPAFVQCLTGRDAREAEELGGALLGRALLALVPICVLGIAAAPWLARALTAGTDDPAVAADQRELATFLLRLFIPQVLLYAYGAVVTAVLHARRQFTVTAVAPIGNTVVMVAALVAFSVVQGDGPTDLDLSLAERLLLASAGTLGVAAFVGIPAVALHRTGFRFRFRSKLPDGRLGAAVRMSGWAGLSHAGTGILLAAALLAASGVSGGVVAYQVAFACFLVPYAVLALPVITAVLTDLSAERAAGDMAAFGQSLRWSLERMVVVTVPVSAAAVVFAPRLAEELAFGRTSGSGGRLIGAAAAALAAGLLPYGAFLLFTRAHYALGEGKGPAVVALSAAVLGAALMAVMGLTTSGDARLAAMGGAHSVAQLAGAVVLGRSLSRRVGERLYPPVLTRAVAVSAALGVAAAAVLAGVDPEGRVATIGLSGLLMGAGGAVYLALVRPRRRP